ncbi:MAG: hypothetical protein CMM50_17270 [Rhodospirillaceae bacterium]|nr:hypothetical protein [Rhodospirillaceae bacterium]
MLDSLYWREARDGLRAGRRAPRRLGWLKSTAAPAALTATAMVLSTGAAYATPTTSILRGGIAFNEILIDPNGSLNFDTDGNGTADTTDEFVELANLSGSDIDIGGLQFWDQGTDNWFTIPTSTTVAAGGFALFVGGVQSGGALPTLSSGSVAFDVGRSGGIFNNGGDNVALYDPDADAFIQFTYNGDSTDDPTNPSDGYDGFSTTANLIGTVEDWGNDLDGTSLTRSPTGDTTVVQHNAISGAGNASPGTEPGTTPPPPPPAATARTIMEIQGSGHTSDFVGDDVVTTGIVTALDSDGFYIQDPLGDGLDETSDGIFVFTGGTPTVVVGDAVEVTGTVDEFFDSTQIDTVTSIAPTTLTGTIAPIVIGTDAGAAPDRLIPTRLVDDAGGATFDADNHGRDFYESLEGMLVEVRNVQATDVTNQFGQIYAITDDGNGATTVNSRGGITISGDSNPDNPIGADLNPERILIDPNLTDGTSPTTNMGDGLGNVVGVMDFGFNDYFIRPIDPVTVTPGSLTSEVSNLTGTADQLTMASFNVLNLDPNDSDGDADVANGRFAALAAQIVSGLKSPDIIGLQEVQDNSGSVNDGETSASETFAKLIQAIKEAGGPEYEFIDNPPDDNQDGGQPGANIRAGFLYNPDRVDLVPGSVERLTDTDGDDAFAGSRNPLAVEFVFNGQVVTVINNHSSSKGGSDPLFGSTQPPANGSLDERVAQAEELKEFIDFLLTGDPNANVVLLGDFNEFQFFESLQVLIGGSDPSMFDLALETGMSEEEIYTYVFEGNSQALDHILVSAAMQAFAAPEFDIVHVNTGFADQASDHDPLLARFTLPFLVAVPEPGGIGFVLLGMIAVVAYRRRR